MSRPTRWDLALAAGLLGALVLVAASFLGESGAALGPHCGCCEPACAMPCTVCCPGATPNGCPPPTTSQEGQ